MDDLEQVAPSAAADESVSKATESTEAVEGQEQDQPAPEESEEKKKSASQERRERRKAHEQRLADEAARERRSADEYRQRLDRIKAAQQGDTPPRETDFSDPVELAAARALYTQRQQEARLREAEIEGDAKAHDERARQLEVVRLRERGAALEEQKAEARAVYADFDQVFNGAFIPQHVGLMIVESDQAADVAYFLGKNPAVARQIAEMNPVQAARELGRIEAKLTLPKPKTQSAAPDPINPVKPGGLSRKDPGSMSPQEFAKWRDAGGTF